MIEKSIIYAIFENAKLYPNKTALISGEGGNLITLSYSELLKNIKVVSEYLSENGVRSESSVLISATQSLEFVYFYFATHLLGAIAVPVNPQLPISKLQFIAEKCHSKTAVLNQDLSLKNVNKILNLESISNFEISGNSDLFMFPKEESNADILFTTGTTGTPKGVMLTHKNIFSGAKNINNFICNRPEDIELSPMPLSHSFGLARLRCNLLLGSTLLIANGLLLPGKILKQIEEREVTGFSSVPAGIAILLKFGEEKIAQFKNQLRYIEIGSAPMPLDMKEKLMDLLPNTRICMHYGLTEASRSTFIEFHSDKNFLNSIGRATPGVKLKIINNEKKECSIGEKGEIALKGNSVSKNYLSFGNTLDSSGWFSSGDLGFIDSNGYVYLSGRISDIINVGGQKVSPIEIESIVNSIHWVHECACVGVDDPNGLTGQSVKLFLVKKKNQVNSLDSLEFELISFLRNKLEAYKLPTIFAWIDNIPKTNSGKIIRNNLT